MNGRHDTETNMETTAVATKSPTTYKFYLDVVNDWMEQLPPGLKDDLYRFGALGELTTKLHESVSASLAPHGVPRRGHEP